MKNKLLASILIVSVLGIAISLLISKTNDKDNATTWASRACDYSLSYEERANHAARANFLDARWLRLSDAVNALAGFEATVKIGNAWKNASGNDGGALYFQWQTKLAQYYSECSLTPEVE